MKTEPPPTAPGVPMTPKEFADFVRRTPRWVSDMCRRRIIPTCPPHRRPYLIPRNVLFKFGVTEQ